MSRELPKNPNSRVIVTGASEGIGRAFCHRFAKEGYRVLAVARNEERLKSLMSELGGTGHSYLVADLSTGEGRSKVTAELARERFTGLVNNAGYGLLTPFSEASAETWTRMIELNITTVVELSHAFLARAERNDFLINVSSTLSLIPMPIQSVYSATKAFVTSFTEALWFQNREKGVRVLNLCPGITATQFNTRAGGDAKELPKALTQTAEEVVDLAWDCIVADRGPTKVSGWKNQAAVLMGRMLSRRQLTSIMGRIRQ